MNVGERIKFLRKTIGLTLDDLSRTTGVSRQTLSRYETGVIKSIPSNRIEALAQALNTSPAYLMGWDDCSFDLSEKSVGERIRHLRILNGLTQEELALAAKVTKQAIYKYETGIVSNIPIARVKAISIALGTTPANILGLENTTEEARQTAADGIGARIKMRREELNMSQEELAIRVGYDSRSSVNKIEA